MSTTTYALQDCSRDLKVRSERGICKTGETLGPLGRCRQEFHGCPQPSELVWTASELAGLCGACGNHQLDWFADHVLHVPLLHSHKRRGITEG